MGKSQSNFGLVWKRTGNICNIFDKSMLQQLWISHVSSWRIPCDNLKKFRANFNLFLTRSSVMYDRTCVQKRPSEGPQFLEYEWVTEKILGFASDYPKLPQNCKTIFWAQKRCSTQNSSWRLACSTTKWIQSASTFADNENPLGRAWQHGRQHRRGRCWGYK